MKVILPDRSELELPDGATGLDAARAIGPKLAEQAVLVRSNGKVRDLRLPLDDGQEIQILTTSPRPREGSIRARRWRSGRRSKTASTTTSSFPSP
jgi:(p)ppGpp synthase/HD superfamily hydrolase